VLRRCYTQLAANVAKRGAGLLVPLDDAGHGRPVAQRLPVIGDPLLEPIAREASRGTIPQLASTSFGRALAKGLARPLRFACQLASD
jgi:hypothetical protein